MAELTDRQRQRKDEDELDAAAAAQQKALDAYREKQTDARRKAYKDATAKLAEVRTRQRKREIDAGRRPAGLGVHVGGRKR